jgi:hypothetical protein
VTSRGGFGSRMGGAGQRGTDLPSAKRSEAPASRPRQSTSPERSRALPAEGR